MKRSKKTYSITEQSLILITGKGAGFFISFAIPLIIVRLTTPEEFGTYKQFLLIFSTLFGIAQFGIVQSIYYFVPSNKYRGVYIWQAYIFLIIFGVSIAVVLWFFQEYIAILLNNSKLREYIPLSGLFICFMLVAAFLEGSLIAEIKVKTASLLLFLSEFLKATAMILPILITGELKYLFVGAVLFAFCRFLATSLYVNNFRLNTLRLITKLTVKNQLRYALPLGISVPLFILSTQLPNYFVSYFYTPEVFAVFAVALFYPPIVEVIEAPIIEPMFVAIVSHLKKGETEQVKQIWHNSVRKLSLALFPILAFFFIEAESIITILFTTQYLSAVPIYMIAIFRIFFAIFIPENVVKAYGQTNFVLKTYAATLIVSIFFLVVLNHWFNLIGVAVALVSKELFVQTVMISKARRLLILPISKCLPWRHLVVNLFFSFVCTLPGFAFDALTNLSPLLTLLISFLIFILCYGLIICNSSLLMKSEKNAILGFVSKLKVKKVVLQRRPNAKKA